MFPEDFFKDNYTGARLLHVPLLTKFHDINHIHQHQILLFVHLLILDEDLYMILITFHLKCRYIIQNQIFDIIRLITEIWSQKWKLVYLECSCKN